MDNQNNEDFDDNKNTYNLALQSEQDAEISSNIKQNNSSQQYQNKERTEEDQQKVLNELDEAINEKQQILQKINAPTQCQQETQPNSQQSQRIQQQLIQQQIKPMALNNNTIKPTPIVLNFIKFVFGQKFSVEKMYSTTQQQILQVIGEFEKQCRMSIISGVSQLKSKMLFEQIQIDLLEHYISELKQQKISNLDQYFWFQFNNVINLLNFRISQKIFLKNSNLYQCITQQNE